MFLICCGHCKNIFVRIQSQSLQFVHFRQQLYQQCVFFEWHNDLCAVWEYHQYRAHLFKRMSGSQSEKQYYEIKRREGAQISALCRFSNRSNNTVIFTKFHVLTLF